MAIVLLGPVVAGVWAQDQPLDLVLPTDNDALYSGDGPAFYQKIERVYKGEKSTPWEGGQYGFVRDPVETPQGLVMTRFHEGIDIRCIHRDSRGEPLDEVRAIADGKVVHANPIAGYSNYGKYIVIEHVWGGCSYFSLYGHLSEIAVQPGQEIHRGERIATMGYTGAGLNRERAHLHLELNVMINHNFERWHESQFKTEPNRNGIYNGLNLAGLDIARLYLALRKKPNLTIPEFLSDVKPAYKVMFPRTAGFELDKKYPWMVSSGPGTESWEVSFTGTSFPLRIEPSGRKVERPTLTWTRETPLDYRLLTQGHLAGVGKRVHFTDKGVRLMQLFIQPE